MDPLTSLGSPNGERMLALRVHVCEKVMEFGGLDSLGLSMRDRAHLVAIMGTCKRPQ